MKITIIADVYGVSDNGTANAAKNLANYMIAKGHEITILSPHSQEDEKGIHYITTKQFHIWGFDWYVKKNNVMLAKPDKDTIIEAIKDADLVHLLLPFKLSKATLPFIKEFKKPYTCSCHFQPENFSSHIGLKDCKWFNTYLYHWVWKKFYKNMEFIHCPSDFIKDRFISYGFDPNRHYYVISNGFTPKFRYEKMEKPKEYQDKIVILNSGRYSNEKRQDILIKAIEKSKYKDKIQLICAGQGPKEKKYRSLAKNLPNPAVFGYLTVPDLIKTLNTADLYVHCADIEIEGISCLEAMACGRPCIFSDSDRSATRDFAVDKENCLFKAGDSTDCAKKIDYLIEHPELREEYSKKYLEYSKKFEIQNCMDEMEKFLKDSYNYYTEFYKNEENITK